MTWMNLSYILCESVYDSIGIFAIDGMVDDDIPIHLTWTQFDCRLVENHSELLSEAATAKSPAETAADSDGWENIASKKMKCLFYQHTRRVYSSSTD